MKKLLIILAVITYFQLALAVNFSAARKPGETVAQAYARNHTPRIGQIQPQQPIVHQSVYNAKKPVSQGIDVDQAPIWSSEASNENVFAEIRDERFLQHDDFDRRISWLYPDDGCFMRAEMATNKLIEKSYPAPSKLFIFGELQTNTPNSTNGFVTWWYHVVPIYNVNGQAVVFDPSVDPKRPLPVMEFVQLINANNMPLESIEYAICSSHTVTPYDDCNAPSVQPPEKLINEMGYFLDLEWSRLEQLNRDPYQELGEAPPWLQTQPIP